MLSNRTSRISRWAAPTMAAALMVASGVAASADAWYIGAGAGQTKIKDTGEVFGGGSDVDDKDTAWKVFGGYQFMSPLAIELGYIDFGKFNGSGPVSNQSWKAKAVDLDLVAGLPVNSYFGVFLKVGGTLWRVDSDSVGGSTRKDGSDFNFGLGAQYDFNRNVGARLEWDRYRNVGEPSNTGRSDLDVVLASVVYRFK